MVRVKAKDVINLFRKGYGEIDGEMISFNGQNNQTRLVNVKFNDFLINDGETAIGKYGSVLNKIIDILKK